MTVSVRRVLVSGATGFVGQRFLDALSRIPSLSAVAAIRDQSALPAAAELYRINEIGPDTTWTPAVTGCDAVVHLAARVHMMADPSSDSLTEYRRVNVDGTLALARQAAAAGVRRFVFVSSVKVNGESTLPGHPLIETDARAPLDPYGMSKAEAEVALLSLGESTGMEVVVIRPPLVYGPGVKANFLTMTRWLRRGVPLPLGALNENRRSLIGLDNLVDALLTCLRHPAAANQVFFVADGDDLSTTDLLRRTAAALGVPARLVPVPGPVLAAGAAMLGKAQTFQRLCGSLQVDIAKARRLLDWNPPFTVDEGLRRAVANGRAGGA